MKTHFLENLLGCPLEDTLAAISSDAAALETFLAKLPTDSLKTTSHRNGWYLLPVKAPVLTPVDV